MEIQNEPKKEITADELREFLKDKRVIMDCGMKFCIHPFSNTMIIHCDGYIICHSCGY